MKVLINSCYGGFGFSESFKRELLSIGFSSEDVMEGAYTKRTDLKLIEAVESFGLKRSQGDYSKLEIVELPDGVKFLISEYDGYETIDSFWIEVSLDELRNGLSDEQLSLVSKGASIKLPE